MVHYFPINRVSIWLWLQIICVVYGSWHVECQVTQRVTEIAEIRHSQGWLRFYDHTAIRGQSIFTTYAKQFDLGKRDTMALVGEQTDELGYTHYRYQQYHGGVPIEGGVFNVHQRNGRAVKGNGKIVTLLSIDTQPHLTKQQALQYALAASPSKAFIWENPAYERWLQSVKSDTASIPLPEPELVLTKTIDSLDVARENLTLAYRVALPTTNNANGVQVYINAHTGAVHRMTPLAKSCTAATANTIFNGEQDIYTYQDGTDYVLQDDCQTTTIETRAYNNPNHDPVVHSSTDWTTNASLEPYTSAHWCGEQAYHYFDDIHGYDDYSAYSNKMLIVVGGAPGLNWWGGGMKYIQIGDTRNSTSSDWGVTLDIIGHEWAHAITDATAELLPFGEHGALFESFGYILGEALEWYVKNTPPTNLIGGLETMYQEYQKDLCASGNDVLDTYCDDDWQATTELHDRSGVQNRWFCLLVNGGTGTNDHCCSTYTYDVSAIGLEKASKIAFRNLSVYLTATSNHIDARQGALEAASDLYGQQTEYAQVAEAWDAVGVYGNDVAWDYLLCGELTGTTTYQAMNEIRTNKQHCGNNDVVVNDHATVEFKAGKLIRLQKGFTTEYGSYFRASISADICADMFPKVGVTDRYQTKKPINTNRVCDHEPLLLVYPNPLSVKSTVQYRTYALGPVSLLLIDVIGNAVQELVELTSQPPGTYEVGIDCTSLSPGMYLCVLRTNTGVASQFVVIE